MDGVAHEDERLRQQVRAFGRMARSGLALMVLPWVVTVLVPPSEAAPGDALLQSLVRLAAWFSWGWGLLGAIGGGFGWRRAADRLHRVQDGAGFLRYALGPGAAYVFLLAAVTVACLSGASLWGSR